MKDQIIVLSTMKYEMENGNKGVTMFYLMNKDLKPKKVDPSHMGTNPAKASLPFEMWEKFAQVPGVYEADFELSVSSKNKTELKPVDVTYQGLVDLVLKPSDEMLKGK